MRVVSIGLILAFLVTAGWVQAEEIIPSPRAHAHNDYEHTRPLLDALSHGFCSVEADIHLVDGALLVGHDAKDLRPERTLQTLYLDPLHARAKANGGQVYPGGNGFTLLIDLKTDGETTYAALKDVLMSYADMLTEFTTDSTTTRAVTVIISGSTPRETIAAQSPRYAAIDGRIRDLEGNPSVHVVPLMSEAWQPLFKWYARDNMPDEVRTKLHEVVAKAHAQGRRVRFYAAPDTPAVWKELNDAGVDLINTDKLAELSAFLRESKNTEPVDKSEASKHKRKPKD